MTDQDTDIRPLGELETAIMEVVWSRGQSTVREVLSGLQRTPSPAYTTVLTVMTRLAEKGLLQRTRSAKVDIYRAIYGREEFGQRVSAAAVRGLVDEFGEVALAQFAAALERADPQRLARLRARFGEGAARAEEDRGGPHYGAR
jgi:predicted transcriptional regulator